MCAVIGALLWDLTTPARLYAANQLVRDLYLASHERGRDGRGFTYISEQWTGAYTYKDTSSVERKDQGYAHMYMGPGLCQSTALIGNTRAEPTTEYIAVKRQEDQQPYAHNGWSIVHNGTIANDKVLRTGAVDTTIDSAAIVEQLGAVPFAYGVTGCLANSFWHFNEMVRKLKGSFAILAIHESEPDHMMVAVNYRPVWYVHTEFGVFFASSRDYLPAGYARAMVEPYTVSSFTIKSDGQLVVSTLPILQQAEPRRALVVCSGGLDSVVAATVAQRRLGYDVELIHFLYGSRAQGREVQAVKAIAKELGVEATLFNLPVYQKKDSPLLNDDCDIAGGEKGAEFAHEWVPARNLVLLSVATAFAEANGFDTLILGNNLEEAGAYPDNEPEFISKFNDLLPFAVADGKQIRVEMPVGNLMKHEIVALGHAVRAPMHLTWSCYRNGEKHCGICGPCYMRRTAFKINVLQEVIEYVQVN